MEEKTIRVMIVDDHQIIIDGLNALLDEHEFIKVVATATDGKMAIEMMEIHHCDVIIMDIKMPDMNGIEATRAIKKKYPKVEILALTTYNEKKLITEIMKAGALGYILKNTGAAELDNAIINVAGGEKYYSKEVALELLDANPSGQEQVYKSDLDDMYSLTQRETEILRLIANEFTTSQIAEQLFISINTVETHRKNLIRKLSVKNLAGLVKFAIQKGLVK